ncbi:hypothetical protein F5141DRAFT_1062657 [Pisolithus sp. B1]|nr:hypothetical protein F5141DRAFT_1062657 [Pisolithus sp. B1]
MELSPFLLLLLQQLLVLVILSLMICLRDSLLMSPTSLLTFCMIPLKILEGGCIIHSWRRRNVGAEQVAVAEMQGKWLREQQDSWDKAPWEAVYTPEVPEGDLVNLGQGLVGGDIGGESPEYASHAQIGKQHYVLIEGMWDG